MSDKQFLRWIYDRLTNKHKEDVFLDYMQRLKAIVDRMPDS